MEIAFYDREQGRNWKTALAMLAATAALIGCAQLLAPSSAAAMDDQNNGSGCQPGFGFMPPGMGLDDNGNFCTMEDSGGGEAGSGGGSGGDSSGGSSEGPDRFHTGDPCLDYGLCDDDGFENGDDYYDDLDDCAYGGACGGDSDKGSNPKGGWDASDDEEADAADEVLGKKPPAGTLQGPGGQPVRPCDNLFRAFASAKKGPEEDAALQRLRECLREHQNDGITARIETRKGKKKSAKRRSRTSRR